MISIWELNLLECKTFMSLTKQIFLPVILNEKHVHFLIVYFKDNHQ